MRAQQFRKLLIQAKLGDLPKGLKMADIGCGDGIISKQSAWDFQVAQLDMYEPYVDEVTEFPQSANMVYNFYKETFDKCEEIYDIVVLSEALHHITNPEVIMKRVGKCLSKTGFIIFREHHIKEGKEGVYQRLFCDVCDKLWSYALTGEEDGYDPRKMADCEK